MNSFGNVLNEREFIISLILVKGYLIILFLANLTVGNILPLVASLALLIDSMWSALSFNRLDLVNDYLD